MIPRSLSARLARGIALAAALSGAALARAQEEAVPLPMTPVVVTATRTPQPQAVVGSDVDVVDGSDVAREQLWTLQDALSGVPSAAVFATGQAGASASIFLRGANSDQTLFLVDGIRINDGNFDYGDFLGAARMFPSNRLEIALGPQSTLYGSDAAGGVISLSMDKGAGRPVETLSGEVGSFGTEDVTASAQGASGSWAYNVGLDETKTDNDRINNAFEGRDLAARIDLAAGKYVDVGATLRGFISRYGDPGDEFTNDPIAHETEENWIGTLFANVELAQYIQSRLTLGGQERYYNALVDGTPPTTQELEEKRGVVDWQNTIEMTEQDHFVAGLTWEEDTDRNDGYGNIDQRQDIFSLYGEDVWNPLNGIYLTGGLRHDDYDSFGGATTGRATAAVLLLQNLLKLRGSYGTGFNAPSFLDLYGIDEGFVGNPSLQPERSQGWDMGVDLYSPKNESGTLSFTFFQTDYENLIDDNFDVNPGTTENIGKARTRGEELTYDTVLASIFNTKLSYTRLEGDDLTDETPLLRRPHYMANADVWTQLGHGFTVGGDAQWVGTRADIDPQTFDDVYDPSYYVLRFYLDWKFNRRLTLTLRVENLLNRYYEPVDGYPALGRGIYGGAQWKF